MALYQRTSTHLSLIQSTAPDPLLTARLTQLVARARSAVTGTRRATWRDAARFLTDGLPGGGLPLATLVDTRRADLRRGRQSSSAGGSAPTPRSSPPSRPPTPCAQMTRPGGEYETYYSSHPAAPSRPQVWTNNAQAAAICLVLGAFFGIPVLWILFLNMLNLGVGIGLMSSAGRLDTFLGLVLPHGLLELTAVFVAAGTGMRLGWTVIDPGPRTRRAALAGTGPSGRRHGHRPCAGPVRLGPHRRLRHPFRPARPGPASASASPRNSPSSRTCTSWAAVPPARASWATWRRAPAAPNFRRPRDVRAAPLTCYSPLRPQKPLTRSAWGGRFKRLPRTGQVRDHWLTSLSLSPEIPFPSDEPFRITIRRKKPIRSAEMLLIESEPPERETRKRRTRSEPQSTGNRTRKSLIESETRNTEGKRPEESPRG